MPPYYLFEDRDRCSMEDLVTGIRAQDPHESEVERMLRDAFEPGDLWNDVFNGDFNRFMRAYYLVKLGLYAKVEDRASATLVVDPSEDDHVTPVELRDRVLERDGRACLCCGVRRFLQMDHIVPYAKGGPTTFENLQTLCKWCNSRKGTKTIDYRKKTRISK